MILCSLGSLSFLIFFFQAEDGIRDSSVTGVQTCALPIWPAPPVADRAAGHRRGAVRQDPGRRAATPGSRAGPAVRPRLRSEERRVGKEGRARGERDDEDKQRCEETEGLTMENKSRASEME